MEKRTMNGYSKFIIFLSVLVLFFGFIHSFMIASDSGKGSEINFEVFLKYAIPTSIIDAIFTAIAIIIDEIISVKEKIDELPVAKKNKKKEEKLASKLEIMNDLLESGAITQEDYDAEMSK